MGNENDPSLALRGGRFMHRHQSRFHRLPILPVEKAMNAPRHSGRL
jgi:hypothetical protein